MESSMLWRACVSDHIIRKKIEFRREDCKHWIAKFTSKNFSAVTRDFFALIQRFNGNMVSSGGWIEAMRNIKTEIS